MDLNKIKHYALKSAKTFCIAAGFLMAAACLIAGIAGAAPFILGSSALSITTHALFYGCIGSFWGFILGGAGGALYGMAAQDSQPVAAPAPPPEPSRNPQQAAICEEPSQVQTTFRDKVTASRAQAMAASPTP